VELVAVKRDHDAEARVFAHVDRARAVCFGLLLVGHRRSIETGEMCWALPGRGWAYGSDLARRDPTFAVVNAPNRETLTQLQARLLGTCVGVTRA
jgi:hypothetical protein